MSLKLALTEWLRDRDDPADQSALRKINEAFVSFAAEQRVERATELLPGVP